MALPEVELNLAGDTINAASPSHHMEMHDGFGFLAGGNKAAMAAAKGSKAAILVSGGKMSALKTTGVFSGPVIKGLGIGGGSLSIGTIAPALISITAMTAIGYVLYRVNDRLMKKLTSY